MAAATETRDVGDPRDDSDVDSSVDSPDVDDSPDDGRADDPRAAASSDAGRSRRVVVVPWVVAVVAIAALVFVTMQWLPLRAEQQARVAVATTARDVVTQLTTWDARDGLDDTIRSLRQVGTPDFADEVDRFFAGPEGESLIGQGASSTAVVADVFVQSVDGDEATVFVVVDQSVSTTTPESTNVVPRRAIVDLQRVEGTWLASDVTVTDGVAVRPGGTP